MIVGYVLSVLLAVADSVTPGAQIAIVGGQQLVNTTSLNPNTGGLNVSFEFDHESLGQFNLRLPVDAWRRLAVVEEQTDKAVDVETGLHFNPPIALGGYEFSALNCSHGQCMLQTQDDSYRTHGRRLSYAYDGVEVSDHQVGGATDAEAAIANLAKCIAGDAVYETSTGLKSLSGIQEGEAVKGIGFDGKQGMCTIAMKQDHGLAPVRGNYTVDHYMLVAAGSTFRVLAHNSTEKQRLAHVFAVSSNCAAITDSEGFHATAFTTEGGCRWTAEDSNGFAEVVAATRGLNAIYEAGRDYARSHFGQGTNSKTNWHLDSAILACATDSNNCSELEAIAVMQAQSEPETMWMSNFVGAAAVHLVAGSASAPHWGNNFWLFCMIFVCVTATALGCVVRCLMKAYTGSSGDVTAGPVDSAISHTEAVTCTSEFTGPGHSDLVTDPKSTNGATAVGTDETQMERLCHVLAKCSLLLRVMFFVMLFPLVAHLTEVTGGHVEILDFETLDQCVITMRNPSFQTMLSIGSQKEQWSQNLSVTTTSHPCDVVQDPAFLKQFIAVVALVHSTKLGCATDCELHPQDFEGILMQAPENFSLAFRTAVNTTVIAYVPPGGTSTTQIASATAAPYAMLLLLKGLLVFSHKSKLLVLLSGMDHLMARVVASVGQVVFMWLLTFCPSLLMEPITAMQTEDTFVALRYNHYVNSATQIICLSVSISILASELSFLAVKHFSGTKFATRVSLIIQVSLAGCLWLVVCCAAAGHIMWFLVYGSFTFLDFSWLFAIRLNWELAVGFDAARSCLALAVVVDVVGKLTDIAAVAKWLLQKQKTAAEVVQVEIKTEAETQPSEQAVGTAATLATSQQGIDARDSASVTWEAKENGGGLTDIDDLDDGMNDELIDETDEVIGDAVKETPKAGKVLIEL